MSDCGDVKKVFVPASGNTQTIPMPINGIEISDKASEKIAMFLSQEDKSCQEYGLFVSVKKDGCSGLSYDMSFKRLDDCMANQDKIFTHHNASVIIGKTSYFYVIGSRLEFTEALTGSGFALINPNVKKSCSCGSSFAV